MADIEVPETDPGTKSGQCSVNDASNLKHKLDATIQTAIRAYELTTGLIVEEVKLYHSIGNYVLMVDTQVKLR